MSRDNNGTDGAHTLSHQKALGIVLRFPDAVAVLLETKRRRAAEDDESVADPDPEAYQELSDLGKSVDKWLKAINEPKVHDRDGAAPDRWDALRRAESRGNVDLQIAALAEINRSFRQLLRLHGEMLEFRQLSRHDLDRFWTQVKETERIYSATYDKLKSFRSKERGGRRFNHERGWFLNIAFDCYAYQVRSILKDGLSAWESLEPHTTDLTPAALWNPLAWDPAIMGFWGASVMTRPQGG